MDSGNITNTGCVLDFQLALFFLSLPPCLSLQRDVVLSEPAIQVRRKGKGKQIWAMEKMENRLVDMRELYQELKDFDEDNPVSDQRQVPVLSSSSITPSLLNV